MQKNENRPSSHTVLKKKINSKRIKVLSIRSEVIKLPEENIRKVP
jgi:hypothetical protein